MALKIYNTLTRTKEEFKPILDNNVGMYCCGPTVYNYAHIGNLRAYIFDDILRRTLLYNNFKLKHVMNLTDVGHLTSDADEGEDKMLKGAKREGKTVWEVAQFYTDAFMKDMGALNIQNPEVVCKATDHINDMIELIKKIEKNGFAYVSGGNVYFDTSKFKEYGELARLKLDDLEAGARIEVDENKKNPSDFVLWFTKSKFDDQAMKWESPWGTGYPGWHIECSAMSMKYLGEQFDIHCGGIDHIPVHHTNEIAQSEAATLKKPWVKYWLHNNFLVMDKNEKMAKSGENFLRLQLLIDKGFDPIEYRYFALTTHYRQELRFSFEGLQGAKNAYNSLKNKVIEIKKDESSKGAEKVKVYESEFLESINDDLNTPKALAVLWAVIKDDELGGKEKYGLLNDFDKVLGLRISEMEEQKQEELSPEINQLIQKREEARKNKDWKEADKIRDELRQKGIELLDTKEGIKTKKI